MRYADCTKKVSIGKPADRAWASYRESVNTAPHYRLYRLDTVPEKPGMVYDDKKGAAIAVEIYELPVVSIGAFLQQVKKPLCIGDVELSVQDCKRISV